MALQETPLANRYTIGLFGRRNAGKSSLINAVTGQNTALTSDVAGTTTDPVTKAMEILPIGPVSLIDTAGIDDTGALGRMRVQKSYEALRRCHLVLLVLDGSLPEPFGETERAFLSELKDRSIPFLIVLNKSGLAEDPSAAAARIGALTAAPVLLTDAAGGTGIEELKAAIIRVSGRSEREIGLTDGLVRPGDLVVLVTPIDSAAPKGRLILPQQQVLRDILDKGGFAVVTKETELPQALSRLKEPPALVITDSQAFRGVGAVVPEEIPLTSFSILFARQRGDLGRQLQGIRALEDLEAGDRVLISEGCTHHRQCGDIGTEKIPKLLRRFSEDLVPEWSSGGGFPEDLTPYRLIIHCGACMLGRNEMQYRIEAARKAGVPITNYGLFIAHATGILERAIWPLGMTV